MPKAQWCNGWIDRSNKNKTYISQECTAQFDRWADIIETTPLEQFRTDKQLPTGIWIGVVCENGTIALADLTTGEYQTTDDLKYSSPVKYWIPLGD